MGFPDYYCVISDMTIFSNSSKSWREKTKYKEALNSNRSLVLTQSVTWRGEISALYIVIFQQLPISCITGIPLGLVNLDHRLGRGNIYLEWVILFEAHYG